MKYAKLACSIAWAATSVVAGVELEEAIENIEAALGNLNAASE